jgi:hypothetical protein
LGYFLKAQAIFEGEIWFVVGILSIQKGADVGPLNFQIELDEDILPYLVWQLFWRIFPKIGRFFPIFWSP